MDISTRIDFKLNDWSKRSPAAKLLYRAFYENRAAHLSIHNQGVCLYRNGTEEQQAESLACCHTELAFTQALDGRIMTVNAQYGIEAANDEFLKNRSWWDHTIPEKYTPKLRLGYDARNFKVRPEVTEGANLEYIDLFDTNYNRRVFIDGYDNVFSSSKRADQLEAELKEEGIDTLILTGRWSTACVPKTAHGAIKRGFTPYIVSDIIFSSPNSLNGWQTHEKIMSDPCYFPSKFKQISSQEVLSLLSEQEADKSKNILKKIWQPR